MKQLRFLTVKNNKIKNIEALRCMNFLETVTLNNNLISDILPLRNLANLKAVAIFNNPIATRETMEVIRFLENRNTLVQYSQLPFKLIQNGKVEGIVLK